MSEANGRKKMTGFYPITSAPLANSVNVSMASGTADITDIPNFQMRYAMRIVLSSDGWSE